MKTNPCRLGMAAYIAVVFMAGALAPHAFAAYAQTYSFRDNPNSGSLPFTPLIQGRDGALYGTTRSGGASDGGTVFRIGADGTGFALLHSFAISSSEDGHDPEAGLIQGNDGALYGTTQGGGASYAGTVFKINTDGTGYALLYSFSLDGNDGYIPQALLQGRDGVLYGTTTYGGTSGNGAIFKINTNGTGYALLLSFDAPSNGSVGIRPLAGLVQGRDGALYGTTWLGGTADLVGTVFKVNTDGTGYTLLHSFSSSGGDGTYPQAGVIQGNDGKLYGSTSAGGTSDCGALFKLNADGTGYEVFYSFSDSGGDGQLPQAGVIQGSDGALYGTTVYGGASDCGALFKVDTDGSAYTLLYSFSSNGGDGNNPQAGLIQGGDGKFYGTTVYGGADGVGSIFTYSTKIENPPVLTSISVTPVSATILVGATQQFTAVGMDQFGAVLIPQPAVSWQVTSGGGSISGSGLYTAPNVAGSAAVLVSSGAVTASASVMINPIMAPVVTSGITATPNPAQPGELVAFSVAAASPIPISFAWNFGDGALGAGSNVVHAYDSAGTFNVTVTITDAVSQSVSATLTLVCGNNGGGGSAGNDGGQGSLQNSAALTISKTQGVVKNGGGHDSVSIIGMLPNLPAPFFPDGQALVLNINGASVTFNLNSHGRSKSGKSAFALKLKPDRKLKTNSNPGYTGGSLAFSATINGTLASAMHLDPTQVAKNLPVVLKVSVELGGVTYSATVDAMYSGNIKSGGKFKSP